MSAKEYKFAIILFFLGFCIICTAAVLSETLKFEPLLGVGPRELGHFVGFIGMSFMMYFYSATCFSEGLFKIMQALHLPFILGAWALLIFPYLKPEFIPFGMLKLIATLSFCYAAFSFSAYKKFPRVKKTNHFILMSAICMVFVSGYWELIHQPLIDVYGKGPRGYIQWPHVRIDSVGIVLATFILWCIAKVSLNKSSQGTQQSCAPA